MVKKHDRYVNGDGKDAKGNDGHDKENDKDVNDDGKNDKADDEYDEANEKMMWMTTRMMNMIWKIVEIRKTIKLMMNMIKMMKTKYG